MANNSHNYYINFDKTFGSAMLIGVEPKMTRADKSDQKSAMVQARDKDGVFKWTVTLVVQTKSFENTKYENIPVTVTSPTKPYEAITPGTQVTVENMELGIMPQQRGGFSVFYSAEAIRPLQPVHTAQSTRAASSERLAVAQ
jgi:hypothetical protein